MIGEEIGGRYVVIEKLGEGGMGEVYLAEHIHLRRREALKVLHPRVASTREFVARFRREARATNRVQHPNIVSVYDFGQLPDRRFYLAMEYADGPRLDAVTRDIGPMPVPRAIGILTQLADAVGYAHSCGVIHRDLKPANIVVMQRHDGRDLVKVLDFGIAKIFSEDQRDTILSTRRGKIFGTLGYISPEQLAAEEVDWRTDIYSLGCIAYQLITGRLPFQGNAMEIMEAHRLSPPDPPSRWVAELPPALDETVLRCLAKHRDDRMQSGADLLAALERVPGFEVGAGRRPRQRGWSAHPPIRVTPPSRPRPTPDPDTARSYGSIRDTLEALPNMQELWSMLGRVDGEDAELAETLIHDDSAEGVRRALFDASRRLAEALIDLGCDHITLMVTATKLADMEADLAGNEAEMQAIEAKSSTLEQQTREREASLRFALGELCYARDQASENDSTLDEDSQRQILELERRLAEIQATFERELNRLTDAAIALVAVRARKQETADKLHAQLEQLLVELAPDYVSDETVEGQFARWQQLCELQEQALGG